MILYLDTSALVKLFVEEAHSARVRKTVSAAQLTVTHAIAYVEGCVMGKPSPAAKAAIPVRRISVRAIDSPRICPTPLADRDSEQRFDLPH